MACIDNLMCVLYSLYAHIVPIYRLFSTHLLWFFVSTCAYNWMFYAYGRYAFIYTHKTREVRRPIIGRRVSAGFVSRCRCATRNVINITQHRAQQHSTQTELNVKVDGHRHVLLCCGVSGVACVMYSGAESEWCGALCYDYVPNLMLMVNACGQQTKLSGLWPFNTTTRRCLIEVTKICVILLASRRHYRISMCHFFEMWFTNTLPLILLQKCPVWFMCIAASLKQQKVFVLQCYNVIFLHQYPYIIGI